MRSMRKTFIFVGSVLLLSLLVFPVAAQIEPISGGDFGIADGTTKEDVGNFLVKIVNAVLFFVGLVAAIVLIYGGVQYIISGGDEGKTEQAKKTILYAVIGLLVIGLSAALVNFVVGVFQ